LRYGSRFRLSRLRQIGLPRPTLDRLLVKRAIYKVNSFQFTRLTRLGLAHQDLQDYWHWLNALRPDEIKATEIFHWAGCSSKFNGVKIFCACGEIPWAEGPSI